MARLILYMIPFTAALVGLLFYLSDTSMYDFEDDIEGPYEFDPTSIDGWWPCDEAPQPRVRVSFGLEPGAHVKGWPSKGGVYVLENCLGIDLDFLKLDRLHETPLPFGPNTAAEEEAHCNRMRQLGAVWWESETEMSKRELYDLISGGPVYRTPRPRFIKVGWPAGGGVWVLNITEHEALDRDAGIVHYAHDMEERCRVIERLGGVFYENPKDWLDVDLP